MSTPNLLWSSLAVARSSPREKPRPAAAGVPPCRLPYHPITRPRQSVPHLCHHRPTNTLLRKNAMPSLHVPTLCGADYRASNQTSFAKILLTKSPPDVYSAAKTDWHDLAAVANQSPVRIRHGGHLVVAIITQLPTCILSHRVDRLPQPIIIKIRIKNNQVNMCRHNHKSIDPQ